jgi:hypothetical protein
MRLQQLFERLSWSRNRAPAAEPAPPTAEPPQSLAPPGNVEPLKLDRLDLQAAIIHHLEWCVLFNEHLSVDTALASHVSALPDASHSGLGRWIAQIEQRAAGTHPQFIALKQEHLRFHALAHQALEHAQNQRMDLASTLLNTEFERSRARVLDMLRQMQKPLGTAARP